LEAPEAQYICRTPTKQQSPVRGGRLAERKHRKMSLLTELEILRDVFLQRWRAYGASEYPAVITSFTPTATRSQHSAQRCRDAGTATLGNGVKKLSTLKELNPIATGGLCNPVGIRGATEWPEFIALRLLSS